MTAASVVALETLQSSRDLRVRRYIEDFTTAAENARSFSKLYEAMVARYLNRVNRGVLWNSAKTFMS